MILTVSSHSHLLFLQPFSKYRDDKYKYRRLHPFCLQSKHALLSYSREIIDHRGTENIVGEKRQTEKAMLGVKYSPSPFSVASGQGKEVWKSWKKERGRVLGDGDYQLSTFITIHVSFLCIAFLFVCPFCVSNCLVHFYARFGIFIQVLLVMI